MHRLGHEGILAGVIVPVVMAGALAEMKGCRWLNALCEVVSSVLVEWL